MAALQTSTKSNNMELTAKQFEQLLCEFCKQDLPPHFTVEHDIKDIGGESGNRRQIDIKIKGRLGVSDILICGEAKNWSDAVGSETIDGLVGKYLSGEIRANKVLLFSNKGFSAPAIKRAKHLGIELIEPREIDKPIQNLPYIVAVGYLGQMIVNVSDNSPQEILIPNNPDDFIILKGDERISFQQNVFRIVVSTLRQMRNKDIFTDLSKLSIQDKNVLYELKQKEGYRYIANFEVEVSLIWDYIFENLPTGILHHINSGETKFVILEGNPTELINKVLLSPTKGNYKERDECIKNVVKVNIGHTFNLCMVDPDRHKTHPTHPILRSI